MEHGRSSSNSFRTGAEKISPSYELELCCGGEKLFRGGRKLFGSLFGLLARGIGAHKWNWGSQAMAEGAVDTSLHEAAREGNVEAVRRYLAADPEARNSRDRLSRTPYPRLLLLLPLPSSSSSQREAMRCAAPAFRFHCLLRSHRDFRGNQMNL